METIGHILDNLVLVSAENWRAVLWFTIAYFFLELMEHSKESKWNPEWTIFGWNIGRLWMNTGTAWRNKDDFGGESRFLDFVFDTILVFLTDAEHFFQMLMFICVGLGVSDFTNSSIKGMLAFLAMAFFGGAIKTVISRLFPKTKLR